MFGVFYVVESLKKQKLGASFAQRTYYITYHLGSRMLIVFYI